MNVRTRKLAASAGIDIRHIEKHADEEFADNLEKFAKLLIEECMGKMSVEFIEHSMIDVAITNTTEYFGIEE
jgi:hypothetical protein